MKRNESAGRAEPSVTLKCRILDAAEEVSREAGIAGLSIERAAGRAGLPPATLRESFATEEALLEGMLSRKFIALGEERLRLLRLAQSISGNAPPALEAILRAYIIPMVKLSQSYPSFRELMPRIKIEADPFRSLCQLSLSDHVAKTFKDALTRALPGIPPAHLLWGLHFLKGAVLHTWENPEEVVRISGGPSSPLDIEAVIDRLASFAAAGLRGGERRDPAPGQER